MNSINLTGTIQRVTTKQASDNQYCLGTIAVYRQYNKETGKATYDYIPFIAWGDNLVKRLDEGSNVALSGTLQSYLKDTGGQYKESVIQLHVNHVDSFGTSSGSNQATIYSNDKPAKKVRVTEPFGNDDAKEMTISDESLDNLFEGMTK